MLTKIRELIRKSKYYSLFFLILHTVGFISSIDAVMKTRTSQGAIAWVVSLNTFPLVALPAYWVLGRSKFEGYILAKQEEDTDLSYLANRIAKDKSEFVSPVSSVNQIAMAAERLAKVPTLTGNTTELLIDGEATFSSIFEGLEQAKKYILVQFFIIKDDDLGRELKSRLISKSRQGIAVYVLYDEIGSYKLPASYIQDMQNEGIQVYSFHSRKGPRNRFQINFRNHRKVVIVDGKTGWIGGHNVGNEYMGRDPEVGFWRDTHLKIEGPACLPLQLSFLEDWHWATDSILELDWQKSLEPKGTREVLIIPTGPADKYDTAGLMFAHAINSARNRIWIASPYFVPDESIITALQLASMRDVDVRILIPDDPDHLIVYLAAFSYFRQVVKSGVKFYRYTKGFMHQKAILVDDTIAGIGTANFDNRSFRLNFEITAMVSDRDFNLEVEEMFAEDFSNARLMELRELEDKPYWFWVLVSFANLTAPIL